MTSRYKVQFRLVQDEDGYPPFDVESVWAIATSDPDEYIIDNIPFFAREATVGDRVHVTRDGQVLLYGEVVRRTHNSLVRLIFFETDEIPKVRRDLESLGCATEFFGSKPIVAVDVPENVKLTDVRKYLDLLESDEILTYEEPIIRHAE